MQGSEVCERGKKGIHLKKGKGLHLGAELTPPPRGGNPSLKVQYHPVHVSSVEVQGPVVRRPISA